jgi:hypothetical protein
LKRNLEKSKRTGERGKIKRDEMMLLLNYVTKLIALYMVIAQHVHYEEEKEMVSGMACCVLLYIEEDKNI